MSLFRTVFALTSLAVAGAQDVRPRPANAQPTARVAQQGTGQSNKRFKETGGVLSLVDDAAALPPELESDVLLQIIEAGLVRSDALKLKLITRAFDRASGAQDDVMRRPWGRSPEETADGLHAIASTVTHLDRISLQTRSVRDVLSLAPQRARGMFDSIPPPRFEPPACNANWYFVPDAYYETLGKVLDGGFSPREVAAGSRADYVTSVFSRIHSHVQLVPAAQLLNSTHFTGDELREIIPVYASVLRSSEGDGFSFNALMSAPDKLFGAVLRLTEVARKQDLDTRALVQALRDYLVSNLTNTQCGSPERRASGSNLPDPVEQFNHTFAMELTRDGLAKIKLSEIRTDGTRNQSAPSPQHWSSESYSHFLLAVQQLQIFEEKGSSRGTDGALWSSNAADLLTQVSTWSETSEPQTEFFHQKAMLLERLAEKTTGASIHGEAMNDFISFLELNAHQQVAPIDWLFHTKRLLALPGETGTATNDLCRFLDSREPMLRVYARLRLMQQGQPASSNSHSGPAACGVQK